MRKDTEASSFSISCVSQFRDALDPEMQWVDMRKGPRNSHFVQSREPAGGRQDESSAVLSRLLAGRKLEGAPVHACFAVVRQGVPPSQLEWEEDLRGDGLKKGVL